MYYVFYRCEDEVGFHEMTQKALEKFINDFDDDPPNFLDSADDIDLAYFPNDSCLIIEGNIKTPKRKTVVTRWEIK